MALRLKLLVAILSIACHREKCEKEERREKMRARDSGERGEWARKEEEEEEGGGGRGGRRGGG